MFVDVGYRFCYSGGVAATDFKLYFNYPKKAQAYMEIVKEENRRIFEIDIKSRLSSLDFEKNTYFGENKSENYTCKVLTRIIVWQYDVKGNYIGCIEVYYYLNEKEPIATHRCFRKYDKSNKCLVNKVDGATIEECLNAYKDAELVFEWQ